MNKKLDEAWITIYHYNDEIIHDMGSEYVENPLEKELDIINDALLELKAIKEANPNKALEDLYEMGRQVFIVDEKFELYYNKCKQYLFKAQEQEKELLEYRKLKEQLDCSLETVFKAQKNGILFKTKIRNKDYELFSDNYTLSLDFVENIGWVFHITDGDVLLETLKLSDHTKTWWVIEDGSR